MLCSGASTKISGEEDMPVRFLRREWKHNKPHLQKSSSDPILSLLPTTRPHFTCQHCGFINTQIPICLWCCWASKEAEDDYEQSMPRPRRVSAPMRVQSPAKRRNKDRTRQRCRQRVTDAGGVSVTCQNTNVHGQDQGAGKDTQHLEGPGFSCAGNAEPADWGSIRLAISGGPRRNSQIRGDEANQTGGAYYTARHSPGFLQVNDKRGESSRAIGDSVDGEVDLHPYRSSLRRADNGEFRGGANLTRTGMLRESERDPMSNLPSFTTPTAKTPGMRTFGDVSVIDYVSTAAPIPKPKERSRLPLRLRRLKGIATPLYINSTVPPPLTSTIISTPPAASPMTAMTTVPSPTSATFTPRTLRRKSHLKIFRSFTRDNDSVDVKDDIRAMMTNGTESSSSSARRPKSDPFGDVLRPKNAISIPPPPLLTPDPSMLTPTRPRAATTSALSQMDSQSSIIPATPALSAQSGPISPTYRKPLYSAIRQNGVCLSPTLPSPLPSPSYARSTTTSPLPSSSKVNEYSTGQGYGYGYGYTSPSSSIFPLYPPAADTMLLSLSLESRPSSSSSSSSSSSDQHDAFGPLTMLRAKCGYGYKRKSKSGSKMQSKRKRDKGRRPTSSDSMRSSMWTMGTEMDSAYQRVFQVPGMGCSMSGETELKLALALRDKTELDGVSLPVSPPVSLSKKTSTLRGNQARTDTNGPLSPGPKPGSVVRRLREMVSRTF